MTCSTPNVAPHTVKPGDVLYEVRSERAGNTTMRRQATRPVYIEEVHEDHVIARWNGNPAKRFGFKAVLSWRRSAPKPKPSVWDRI